MARKLETISLDELSKALREARERKGWTLEELSHELWDSGFATSQNKLWRMENKPPKRIDMDLLLRLERLLEVELISSSERDQVLLDDVHDLLDEFLRAKDAGEAPIPPKKDSLASIHRRLARLVALEP